MLVVYQLNFLRTSVSYIDIYSCTQIVLQIFVKAMRRLIEQLVGYVHEWLYDKKQTSQARINEPVCHMLTIS